MCQCHNQFTKVRFDKIWCETNQSLNRKKAIKIIKTRPDQNHTLCYLDLFFVFDLDLHNFGLKNRGKTKHDRENRKKG